MLLAESCNCNCKASELVETSVASLKVKSLSLQCSNKSWRQLHLTCMFKSTVKQMRHKHELEELLCNLAFVYTCMVAGANFR